MTEIEIAKAIADSPERGACPLTYQECKICPVQKHCVSSDAPKNNVIAEAKAYLAAHEAEAGFEVGKWYRDTSGRMLDGEPHQVLSVTDDGGAIMDKYPNGAVYGMGDGVMRGTFIEVPAPSTLTSERARVYESILLRI